MALSLENYLLIPIIILLYIVRASDFNLFLSSLLIDRRLVTSFPALAYLISWYFSSSF